MQAAYEVAFGRLMADLAKMTKIAPEVRVDFTDPDDCQYTFVHPNGSSHGTVLMPLEDVEAATVELAKPFQDHCLEVPDHGGRRCPDRKARSVGRQAEGRRCPQRGRAHPSWDTLRALVGFVSRRTVPVRPGVARSPVSRRRAGSRYRLFVWRICHADAGP